MEIIAGVEPVLHRHRDKGAACAARAAVCNVNIVSKAKPPPSNITKDERRALEELRKNPDIVIAKADKGNATVVMDRKAYEEKATEVLEKSPVKRIGQDQTKRIENRINRYPKTLRDRGSIDSNVYNELRVSVKCTRPALFYGLPKIHKPDVPVRPIVSYVGHALYNTSKHLSRILSPFAASFSSFVQNSAHLCKILRNVTIGDDKVLVRFDVKSLYTSVPI